MKRKGKEIQETICVERFLNWYNKEHNRNYTYEKATDHFPELNNNEQGHWDFVVYERANPEEWIGIEVKGLAFLSEASMRSRFWKRLCSDLTKHLPGKGIQGRFEISLPPVLDLAKRERPRRLVKAISEVLIHKQSGWEIGESKDFGSDIAEKFPSWPKQRSDVNEWDKWGRDRPCKLEIEKISDSGCKVSVAFSPLIEFDVVEEHKEALNEVFKLKNGLIKPDRQLKLAKEKGAMKTILLLPSIGADEGLIKDYVQDLDHQLISHIDCIYLVDMGDGHRVVKIYPG